MTEIIIYLTIGIFLSSVRRVISGMKNGTFYGKGNVARNPKLDKYINNIHYLETPAWYAQFGSLFFLVLAVLRLANPEAGYIQQVICSIVVTMGSSGLASFYFQGWINYGEGSPFYNPKEDKMSEFAFWKWSIWWNRGFMDKFKKQIPIFGAISIIIGLYIGLFQN